jgi:hypothetical protein
MFLFTTPSAQATPDASRASAAANAAGAGNPVVRAIREGADRTGTGFDYLLRTAQRESALDPQAKATTSSATGLFQFIDQTWLGMVRQEGSRHGLAAYADAIKDGESGRLTVPDAKTRQDILDLRRDPKVASVMAGELTLKNNEALSAVLGRKPSQGELYIAHVMGARGAAEMINGMANAPQEPASALFPEAAGANRTIFFDKAGKPRPTAEVYAMLTASHASNVAAIHEGAAEAGQASAASEPLPGVARARGTMGLFSTEGSRAPLSDSASRNWATPRGPRVTALDAGPRFFPREATGDVQPGQGTDRVQTAAVDPATTGTRSAGPLVPAPLPPLRPVSLGAEATAAPARGKPMAERRPLDLSAAF